MGNRAVVHGFGMEAGTPIVSVSRHHRQLVTPLLQLKVAAHSSEREDKILDST